MACFVLSRWWERLLGYTCNINRLVSRCIVKVTHCMVRPSPHTYWQKACNLLLIHCSHAPLYPSIVQVTMHYLCEPFTNSHPIQAFSRLPFNTSNPHSQTFSKQCHVVFLVVMTTYSEDVLNLIAVGLLDYGCVLLFFSNYLLLKSSRSFFFSWNKEAREGILSSSQSPFDFKNWGLFKMF